MKHKNWMINQFTKTFRFYYNVEKKLNNDHIRLDPTPF